MPQLLKPVYPRVLCSAIKVGIFNSKSDTEERIGEQKDGSEGVIQKTEQREQKIKNMEERLKVMENKWRSFNIYLVGVLEERVRQGCISIDYGQKSF